MQKNKSEYASFLSQEDNAVKSDSNNVTKPSTIRKTNVPYLQPPQLDILLTKKSNSLRPNVNKKVDGISNS